MYHVRTCDLNWGVDGGGRVLAPRLSSHCRTSAMLLSGKRVGASSECACSHSTVGPPGETLKLKEDQAGSTLGTSHALVGKTFAPSSHLNTYESKSCARVSFVRRVVASRRFVDRTVGSSRGRGTDNTSCDRRVAVPRSLSAGLSSSCSRLTCRRYR